MFRNIRRTNKELPQEEAVNLLKILSHGTLALAGDNDYPYSVPISFAYFDNKIYFHGSVAGQKYELLEKYKKVSFSGVEKDDVCPEKFTTYYKSVIVFGIVRKLEKEDEIKKAMDILLEKYSPKHMESGRKYVMNAWDNFAVYEINIENMTAKGLG